MHVVPPCGPLRRGVRRLALAICAIVLGAGFSPALPSTVEPATAPAAFSRQSTVDIKSAPRAEPAADEAPPRAAVPAPVAEPAVPVGRPIGAVAGRAPPHTSA